MRLQQCPTPQDLAAFELGDLPEDAQEALAEHVETCVVCEKTLQDMESADGVLSALRHAAAPPGADSTAGGSFVKLPLIPGYEVASVLGQGGMGVVYRARHLRLDRPVALKMLLSGTSKSLTRFRAEAEAVARLQHPNIVQVFDVGEHQGRPFLALELVEGGSLAERIAGKPQPPRQTAELLQVLAHAIQHAHERGVVHRDLKPSNVLISGVRSQESGVREDIHAGAAPSLTPDSCPLTPGPKITDFGLARRLGEDEGFTEDGEVIGTPCYMAPEQTLGTPGSGGPSADIYSLGVILYEALTGRTPFNAPTPIDTFLLVRRQEPVPPRRLQPKVPRDLETICLKCLEKDPARRYPTAEALAEDLGRFLAGQPIQARPISVAGRAWRWCRRNPVVAGLLAALALALVGGFAATVWQMRAAQDHAESESQARGESDLHRAAAEVRERDARTQRQRALRATAITLLDQGITECEKGEVAHGLLLFARALEEATLAEARDLEHAIRMNLAAWRTRLVQARISERHGTAVTSVCYSPDGKTIVTGAWGNRDARPGPAELQLFDAANWMKRGNPMPHPGPIWGVAFSPNGKTIATACWDGHVRFWDVESRQMAGLMLKHPKGVHCVAFSPDGEQLLTGCLDGAARVWSISKGEVLLPPLQHQGIVYSVAISPDGETALTGSADRTARTWELSTGKPRAVFPHSDAVRSAAFSPDSRLVATGCEDHVARLWEPKLGVRVGLPMPHPFPVYGVAFSPDGRFLVTAAGSRVRKPEGQGEVRLWDLASCRPASPPLPTEGILHGVAISPDSREVVAVAEDSHAHLWNVAGMHPVERTLLFDAVDARVEFSRDSALLYVMDAKSSKLFIVEAATGKVKAVLQDLVADKPAFSPDGKLLCLIDPERTARLYDARTGACLGALPQPGTYLRAAFSPDGGSIVSAHSDRTTRRASVPSREPLGKPLAHEHEIRDMAVHPGGQRIVTMYADHTARQWNLASGEPVGKTLAHGPNSIAGRLAYSPDGKLLFSSVGGPAVYLWDADTGKRRNEIECGGAFTNGDFSADSRMLLTHTLIYGRSDVGSVQVWNVADSRPLSFSLPRGAIAANFSADCRMVVTAEEQGTRLRDLATARPIGPPLYHQTTVATAKFSPTGRQLVTSSDGRLIRLWSVPTPMLGDAELIRLTIEVQTGQELDAAGMPRRLEEAKVEERKAALAKLQVKAAERRDRP